MKIRLGFVTNSSSSSFLLAFNNKEEIETLELNHNSYVYKILNDSTCYISENEAIAEYKRYLKGTVEDFIKWDIMDKKSLNILEFKEWKKNNPDEYQSEYNFFYKKNYTDNIERLKEILKDKKIICPIYCYDADPLYDFLTEIKQCALILDDE